MNKNYKLLDIELFEEKIKNFETVLVVKKNEIINISKIVNDFLKKEMVENKKKKNNGLIFNYGKSSEYIVNYILKNQ